MTQQPKRHKSIIATCLVFVFVVLTTYHNHIACSRDHTPVTAKEGAGNSWDILNTIWVHKIVILICLPPCVSS